MEKQNLNTDMDGAKTGTSFKDTKHKKGGVVIAVVAAVVLLSGGIAFAALNQGQSTEPEPVITPTAPVAVEESLDSTVFLTVDIGDVDAEIELAATAKVEALEATESEEGSVGKETEPVIKETEVAASTAVELGKLEEGDYILSITQAPVHKDGSTYTIPEEGTKFSIDGKGEDTKLTVELEPLAIDDMTKEQLEAVAAILEDTGHTEAATGIREKAQTAESAPGSADNVAPGSSSPTAPGNTDNNGGNGGSNTPAPGNSGDGNNGGGNNTSTPTQPTDPNAGKTWHEAITEQVWVVDVPASSRQEPIYETHVTCNGCGAILDGNAVSHIENAPRGSSCTGYGERSIIVGYKTVTVPEQGHWETRVIREAGWY